MFGKLFKRKLKVSKEEFGQYTLSRIILISAQKCPAIFEEFEIEMDFVDYLVYLEYLLFLSKKILEQKYSSFEIKIILNAAIDGMIDCMDNVDGSEKGIVKNKFKIMYSSFESMSEEICNDIGSETGLKNLANSFLECFGVSKGILENVRVFTELSCFVIYHTDDVLGKGLKII